MKKEQNQLKEAFLAFREIQNKLNEGLPHTFKLGGKELTLLVTGLYIEYGGKNGWCISTDEYSCKCKCELSKWVDRHFYPCFSDFIKFDKNSLKIFEKDLAKLENLFSGKGEHAEEFYGSYYNACRNATKKSSVETLFKRFEKQYSELVASKIQHQEARKQKEKAQTNPEEFVSINGVLVSKEEIKKLAASL